MVPLVARTGGADWGRVLQPTERRAAATFKGTGADSAADGFSPTSAISAPPVACS